MLNKYCVLLFVVPLLLFSACGEETSTTKPAPAITTLLTLHVDNYYLDEYTPEGIVFASAAAGNLLDMKIWTGAGTVVLTTRDAAPDSISFTIVQYSDLGISLVTELGVATGAERSLTGYPSPKSTGEAEVTFLNPPELLSYRLSSNWSTNYEFRIMPDQQRVYLYGESTDFFVRVDPVAGDPVGGWLRDLRPGETRVFDFQQPGLVTPLNAYEIQIPSGRDDVSYNVFGSIITESGPGQFNLDFDSFTGDNPTSITVYAPEYDHSNLVTRIHLRGDFPGPYYIQQTTGPIPSAFTKMEGELNITFESLDDISFTTTASWDGFSAYLDQGDDNEAIWQVDGPPTIQSFALPVFPEYLADVIPDFPRDGFNFSQLTISQNSPNDVVRSMWKFIPQPGPGLPKLDGVDK